MVIALLPLWGGLLGAAGALANAPPWLILLAWIALTRIEQRILRLSNAYLLATAAAGLVWLRFPPAFDTAITAHAVARAGMIALLWISRPAASAPALAITSWAALTAIGTGIAIAFAALDYRPAITICLGAWLVVRLVREASYRRKGGIDNFSLAAAKGLTEAMAILICSLL